MRVKEFFCLTVGRQAPESGSSPVQSCFRPFPSDPAMPWLPLEAACELGIQAGLASKPLTSRLCSLTVTGPPPKAIMKTRQDNL